MEEKELQKLVDEFVKKCKANNYIGLAVAAPLNGQKSKIGFATDYLKAVTLVRNIFRRLEELTEIPSTVTVTHLALSLAMLEVQSAKGEPLGKVDSKKLAEAAEVVKQLIDFELEKAKKTNY